MAKITLVIVIIYLFVSCSGTGTDQSKDSPAIKEIAGDNKYKNETEVTSELDEDGLDEKLPVITEVKFESSMMANNDIVARPVMSEPDDSIVFRYRWFINKKEVTDVQSNVLMKEYIKKGDWINCWVKLIRGDEESGYFRSKFKKIKGSPPAFDLQPVSKFMVPGSFYYKIDVKGQETYDKNNPLRFELISPRDAGINFNSETGEIRWFLDEDTVKKFGDQVKIRFQVYDKDGGGVSSFIVLNLKSKEVKEEA